MRKTFAVVTLAAVLTGGTATFAYAYADDVVAAPPVTQTEEAADESKSDKSGLFGLLGLARQKENHGVDADLRRLISEEGHEVVLTEERPVVQKEAVPVERIKLGTEQVTENAGLRPPRPVEVARTGLSAPASTVAPCGCFTPPTGTLDGPCTGLTSARHRRPTSITSWRWFVESASTPSSSRATSTTAPCRLWTRSSSANQASCGCERRVPGSW